MKQSKSNRQKVSNRRRIEERYPISETGNPEDYLLHLMDLPRTTPILSASRVSGRQQSGNLSDQREYNAKKIAEAGFSVVAEFEEISSGWVFDQYRRSTLIDAISVAKRHGATIVFHDVDRALRNADYRDDNDLMPTKHDYEQFLKLLGGVPVALILPPNTPRFGANGIRSEETKRGQASSGKLGGRPSKKMPGDKKRQKREMLLKVLALANTWVGVREIARQLGLPSSTVHDWINRYFVDYSYGVRNFFGKSFSN